MFEDIFNRTKTTGLVRNYVGQIDSMTPENVRLPYIVVVGHTASFHPILFHLSYECELLCVYVCVCLCVCVCVCVYVYVFVCGVVVGCALVNTPVK